MIMDKSAVLTVDFTCNQMMKNNYIQDFENFCASKSIQDKTLLTALRQAILDPVIVEKMVYFKKNDLFLPKGIVFLAKPKGGKNTLAEMLEFMSLGTVMSFSIGALIREIQETHPTFELDSKNGFLADSQVVTKLFQEQIVLARDKTWISCGSPRKLAEAMALDPFIDKAIHLEVSDDLVLERAIANVAKYRQMNLPPREDDGPEVVRRRLKDYGKTLEVVDYFDRHNKLHTVDANLPLCESFEQILDLLLLFCFQK